MYNIICTTHTVCAENVAEKKRREQKQKNIR